MTYSDLFEVDRKQYENQLQRVKRVVDYTKAIEQTISEATSAISNGSDSFVIYGEPQSGKTEMMICLVGKLLDLEFRTCVVLVNDSVDLLNQNLQRFQSSGLSPTPERLESVLNGLTNYKKSECIVFCKKNTHDLRKLIQRLDGIESIAIIDDEADFATPNAKINKAEQTRINQLVLELKNLGKRSIWIGVTATPARLDLNNTIENDRTSWVHFGTHPNYCGHEVFFPSALEDEIPWTLVGLPDTHDQPRFLKEALCRFLVNVGDLNCELEPEKEKYYCMIVHTSGFKRDHDKDREIIDKFFISIADPKHRDFESTFKMIDDFATAKYGTNRARKILAYVAKNCRRKEIAMINSNTDKDADIVESATNPRVPFTVAIGGNIISRGVTFSNLLTMFFTRTARNIQQDTYIQRARMFGNRLPYLDHFELHIQQSLYRDWHECFVLHRLAIASIASGRPVWPELGRIRAVAPTSLDNAHVVMDRREVEFNLLEMSRELREVTNNSAKGWHHFENVVRKLPVDYVADHLIEFIKAFAGSDESTIVWHKTSSIENFKDADSNLIQRKRGFFGQGDLERDKFPNGVHHFKFYMNRLGKARLFYKYTEGKLRFVKWRSN